MRTLQTPVCTLEPQVAAHAADMFVVLNDPAIYEFENTPPNDAGALRERFKRLETRQNKDGSQLWLNWVIRLPTGELAGFTQATVVRGHTAYIAYVLASRFWRHGIASSAVTAMLAELASQYGVCTWVAVLKARNFRSHGLLVSLGFRLATAAQAAQWHVEPDEIAMFYTR